MSRLHGRVAMAVYVLWGAVGSVLSAWLTRVIYGNKRMTSEDQYSQKQNLRRELISSPTTPPSQWAESQLLHVACAYSNPLRCHNRRDLMYNFMPHMRNSPNVVLHVGELAYGDRPFEVTGADPFDVQLRTEHELWHKENILNAVISRFPADWKYGAYVDGDFVMTRYDWALEAIQQLQHHDFVQLFSGYSDMTADHRPFRVQPSFSYAQRNYTPAPVGSALRPSRARNATPGATGGAWAFRLDALHKVGGLLETCILGAAAVTGEVLALGKKNILRRGGKPMFRLIAADAVDGTKLKVKAAPGRSSDKNERNIEPPGHRGKESLAPAGSTYLAYFDGDQTVAVKK